MTERTVLLATAAEMRHAEAAMIWQRYIAMLLANTLIVAPLMQAQMPTYRSELIVLGFVTSIVWLGLTWVGWRILEKKIAVEESYADEDYKRLHQASYHIELLGVRIDSVKVLALILPIVFCGFFLWIAFR